MGNQNSQISESTLSDTQHCNQKSLLKAKKREEKDKHVRDGFGIGDRERVIQNYWCTCSWEKDSFVNLNKGRLYLTQNYLLYEENTVHLALPFIEVKNIDEEKHTLTWITIETSLKKYYFGRFYGEHYKEANSLLLYLWKNPPSYVSLPKEELKPHQPDPPPTKNIKRKDTWGFDLDEEETSRNNPFNKTPSSKIVSDGNSSIGSSQVQLTVQVNTDASKQALSTIYEVQKIGSETLVELEKQAKQIDNIENAVENIHANLDKAERLLRGIESLPNYIGNSLSKKKEIPRAVDPTPKNRTIEVQKSVAPPMEIEILCKKVDCSLQLAILLLSEDGFRCIDHQSQLILPEYNYKYTDINEIVIRTRPEHMDIRFNPPRQYKERFRLMSSYNQILVNEFYYRTNGKAKVIFEIGSTPFEYGIEKISVISPIPRRAVENGFSYVNNKATGFKTSSLMGDNVSQKVKDQLDTNDKNLNEISSVLVNVYEINIAMGKEIDRQNEQLDRVNIGVDNAADRVNNSNLQMGRIIKS